MVRQRPNGVRILISLAAAALLVVAPGGRPAAASCIGPRIERAPGVVERGGSVRVTGAGWGEECYDTGPPPVGQGGLGRPRDDIEVAFVQAGRRTVVARGAADDCYGFVAEVRVPRGLVEGPAVLTAGAAGARPPFDRITARLVITAAGAPASGARDRAVDLEKTKPAEQGTCYKRERDTASWILWGGGCAAVVAVALAAGWGLVHLVRERRFRRVRRRRRPPVSPPAATSRSGASTGNP